MKRSILLFILLLIVFGVTLGVVRSRAARIPPLVSPEIVSFTVSPRLINAGEFVTLRWETRGAASVAIVYALENQPRDTGHRVAGLPPVGSLRLDPRETTVYILECEDPAGEVCMAASATVRVR